MKTHKPIYFISDIHLTPEKPSLCSLFKSFIETHAYKAEALYILGDLFDVWLGDDLMAEFELEMAELIKSVSNQGVKTFLITGNRDFLIGKRFAAHANIKLLSDPSLVEIHQQQLLLCHGDALCTEDKLYQYYRFLVRSAPIKWLFGHLSRNWRSHIAQKLRANSKEYQKHQPLSKLDVTEAGVQKCIQKYPAQMMIHGHVHKPNLKTHQVNGQSVTRHVLGTWHHTGSVIKLQPEPFAITHHVFEVGTELKAEVLPPC